MLSAGPLTGKVCRLEPPGHPRRGANNPRSRSPAHFPGHHPAQSAVRGALWPRVRIPDSRDCTGRGGRPPTETARRPQHWCRRSLRLWESTASISWPAVQRCSWVPVRSRAKWPRADASGGRPAVASGRHRRGQMAGLVGHRHTLHGRNLRVAAARRVGIFGLRAAVAAAGRRAAPAGNGLAARYRPIG